MVLNWMVLKWQNGYTTTVCTTDIFEKPHSPPGLGCRCNVFGVGCGGVIVGMAVGVGLFGFCVVMVLLAEAFFVC